VIRSGLPVLLLTASSIEQSIASLDGIVDRVGADLIIDLPQPKAHLGHYNILWSAIALAQTGKRGLLTLIAAAELDG
jgi:hypothetical protein